MLSFIATAAAAVLYAKFLATESQRLAIQRVWFGLIRETLRDQGKMINLTPPTQSGERVDKTRFHIMVCLWIFALAIASFSFCSEGNLNVVLHIALAIVAFTYALAKGKSIQCITYLARINMLQQAIVTWYFDHETLTVTRRTILLRVIAQIVFFESLEECFVNLWLVSAVLFTKRHLDNDLEQNRILLLPFKMYLLAVVPMHVLGVSDMITTPIKDRDLSAKHVTLFFRGLTFLSCLIPMHIICNAFITGAVQQVSLALGVAFTVTGLFLRTSTFGSKINRWIAPCTVRFSKSPRHVLGRRTKLKPLLHSVVVLLMVLWLANLRNLMVLVYTVAVIIVLCEERLFNRLQANLSLLTGGLLVLGYGDIWFNSVVGLLGSTATFACLAVTCAKELIFAKIQQENEAESFLSHAVKQKFASVANACEHVLMDKSKDENNTLSSSCLLLRTAMLECRMGHARCHASTLYRKLEQGEKRGASKRYFDNLQDQLRNTSTATLLITEGTQFNFPCSLCAEVDWEILHLVLSEFAHRRHYLREVLCERNRIVFRFYRLIAALGCVLQRLVAEMRGHTDTDRFFIKTRFKQNLPPTNPSAASAAAAPPRFLLSKGGKHTTLSALKFALVDDNVLIRKSFERLLHHNLGVPLGNILTVGDTEEDCLTFAKQICERKVDIAIFDQNLDFDGQDRSVVLKGSDLAKEAQRRGFRGCLILHSSDVNISELMQEGVFHGAIEKTADVSQFVESLNNAWRLFGEERNG